MNKTFALRNHDIEKCCSFEFSFSKRHIASPSMLKKWQRNTIWANINISEIDQYLH